MHVTFLGHAQLLVRAAGRALLCDPWFAEPVFAHAWWRYPPPPYPNAASLPRPDALLLSHIHPDHSGPGTLAQLDPDTPTLALPFASGALRRRLARAGYSRVTWVTAWQPHELAEDVRVTFVPHDRGWEVASMVIEAGGVRLYHGNDNTLSLAAYQEIVARLGPIDIAFLPFAGASSFPTCFAWDRATILEQGQRKQAEGVRRLTDGITGLRPRVAVPFASSWALLGDDELWKNFVDRPTPAQAAAGAAEAAAAAGSEILLLDSGDEWAPASGAHRRGLTAGWTYDQAGVARYAAAMREPVAAAAAARAGGDAEQPDAARLDRAFRAYFGEMLERTRDGTKELRMIAGFAADGPGGGAWHLIFEPGSPPVLAGGPAAAADETLTLSVGELWHLLTGPSNWEDPWYGYRLRVAKRPGAGYYRAFWEMLLNFDDEALSERLALWCRHDGS